MVQSDFQTYLIQNNIQLRTAKSYANTDILKILQDQQFRNECVKNIVNPEVRNFWEKEFKNYGKTDLIPIYNKLGGILS